MTCGGSVKSASANYELQADNRCIKIDFAVPAPQWTQMSSMLAARMMPNGINLPDGTIMFCCGSNYGLSGGNAGGTSLKLPDPLYSIYRIC